MNLKDVKHCQVQISGENARFCRNCRNQERVTKLTYGTDTRHSDVSRESKKQQLLQNHST